MFKLLGVLCAADIFWNPEKKLVLIHVDGEALEGGGPRILVKANRTGWVTMLLVSVLLNMLVSAEISVHYLFCSGADPYSFLTDPDWILEVEYIPDPDPEGSIEYGSKWFWIRITAILACIYGTILI